MNQATKIELKRTQRVAFPMGILDIVLSNDEKRLFAACLDGVYRLDLADEGSTEKPQRIGQHSSYVSSVRLIQEQQKLVSCGFDGFLQVRDVSALRPTAQSSPELTTDSSHELLLEPVLSQRIHQFWSWDMALSPDQQLVASVTGQYLVGKEDYAPARSDEPTVKLYSAAGELRFAFEMLPSVQCVAFDSTGQYLAAANLMGDIAVWDTSSGQNLAQWRTDVFTSWGIIKSHCYIGGIFAIQFAPDSQSLYVAGMGQMRDPMAGNGKQLWQRYAWRDNPPKLLQETKADESGEGLMEVLHWHPSGKHFLMAGRLRGGNWNLGIFDQSSGDLIGQAKTGMRITAARYSQDGQKLYLAGMQGQPGRKDNQFPAFGYLECYTVT